MLYTYKVHTTVKSPDLNTCSVGSQTQRLGMDEESPYSSYYIVIACYMYVSPFWLVFCRCTSPTEHWWEGVWRGEGLLTSPWMASLPSQSTAASVNLSQAIMAVFPP